MLTDKDVKIMLQEYYKTFSRKDNITQELIQKNKKLDDILESLTLTSQRLSGMPHGNNTTKPVERIYEEYEKIQKQYAENARYIRTSLEDVTRKQRALSKWIEDANLSDIEKDVIKYMYKDGLRDWKIAQITYCSTRSVWNYKNKAYNKLKSLQSFAVN